jgi:hypothetical protein
VGVKLGGSGGAVVVECVELRRNGMCGSGWVLLDPGWVGCVCGCVEEVEELGVASSFGSLRGRDNSRAAYQPLPAHGRGRVTCLEWF